MRSGEEIYSLFGHTAIRYEEPARGIDRVYNYGLFSFNTPNFTLRFALGNANYRLGVEDYRHFAVEYEYFGRSVWQQTLNLTAEEQQQLITLLEENYRPENRIYRYNFSTIIVLPDHGTKWKRACKKWQPTALQQYIYRK